jgi:outer membrane cobalamin receptor
VQKASDAPANLTIISQDDIRRSGANTIPDVLRFVAGIDVRQEGGARNCSPPPSQKSLDAVTDGSIHGEA